MPIPFILIGIGAGAAALGIGKGIKAFSDNSEAGDVNANADSVIERSRIQLEHARSASGVALKCLGSKKVYVLDKSIGRFAASFEKLKNVELKDSGGLLELQKFRLDSQAFSELKEMHSFAESIAGGAVGGALGGALTAFGSYGAAAMFASASTGTAIATLSGAAATNATLAFFGGGALAVGGLGVAGGALVLGGLVAGPALAVMGFVVGAKAAANLDNAYSNLAKARQIAEELETGTAACNAIRRRAFLFLRLLIRLDYIFLPLITKMENIIAAGGNDFSTFSSDDKNVIAESAAAAAAIKSIIDTPILTENGELTAESKNAAENIRNALGKKEDAEPENEFIFCTNCGTKLLHDAMFCTECGNKLKNL
jgi:hypothetical protein